MTWVIDASCQNLRHLDSFQIELIYDTRCFLGGCIHKVFNNYQHLKLIEVES